MDEQITESKLIELQKLLPNKSMLVLKFTADWCGPCKGIKSICDNFVSNLPKSIYFIEIDIDESLELYVKLKNKKMVNGIPALLAFYDGQHDFWYVPDDSQMGGDKKQVEEFFERCIAYVS